LTASEHAVFKLLSTDDAAHIDALAEATQLSVPELTSALLGLEMRELIRQLPGKCFVRKI
jgi:predicted Rossmann fold nucleotide-binding protein DprA/Smf involved in DNA uptake